MACSFIEKYIFLSCVPEDFANAVKTNIFQNLLWLAAFN